ncbi:MAG: hypothetical protein VYC39_11240 [Myxococcota bacterium]|nr:hypothetical protein [Myxococcota bacterium]
MSGCFYTEDFFNPDEMPQAIDFSFKIVEASTNKDITQPQGETVYTQQTSIFVQLTCDGQECPRSEKDNIDCYFQKEPLQIGLKADEIDNCTAQSEIFLTVNQTYKIYARQSFVPEVRVMADNEPPSLVVRQNQQSVDISWELGVTDRGDKLTNGDKGSPLSFLFALKNENELGDYQKCPDSRCQTNPDGGFILRLERNSNLPPGERDFGRVRVEDAAGNLAEANLTAVN